MKSKLVLIVTIVTLLFPKVNFGQAPTLGTAANFELFTSVGAITNTGISQVTGNVGSNSGSGTGFGNVNGVMDNNNGATAQCAADLLIAYNQLNGTVPTFFPAPLLGNGQVLVPGVYSISGATTMNLSLTLDAQGNSNAVFIFQIQGPLSTNANSKVNLINGALACNVFWKIEGLVSMASGTTMRGTVIANNAAINMNPGDTLEGRALSTTGAISINGVLAYTPVGCGSPLLTGPAAPALSSTACYAIFSANGAVTNAGVTYITGDVGTNVGLTTGFNALNVNGVIHPIPDGSTAACAADLHNVYVYLNSLTPDIELLYPAQFGRNLVLTPHTYLMNAAAALTDTLYLNAMGDTNAVFVFQINGALTTSTFSKVILRNGTQAKNVFWDINGAVGINDYSVFNGTIICNNGAVSLNTGATIAGRVLTTTGSFTTAAITDIITSGCNNTSSPIITTEPENQTTCSGGSASFTVLATGAGLTYQWKKGNTILVNGGNISGANMATLTINPATTNDAASNYIVVVSGTYAPSVSSGYVSLIIGNLQSPIINSNSNPMCPGSSSTLDAGVYSLYNWSNGGTNETINVTTAGTYYVTVTNSSGCSSVGHIAVLAYLTGATPQILTSGISNLCGGGSATLWVGASFSSYIWSNGATTQSISINAGGTYSVTVTNSNGCPGTATTTIPIVGCNTPTSISTLNVTGTSARANWMQPDCYYNYSIRISLRNANIWTTYTFAPNIHYTFSGLTRSTAYDWQIRTNCNSSQTVFSDWSSTFTFTTLANRIEEKQTNSLSSFNLYPNPANESVTIAFSSENESSYVLELTDMMGKIVKNEVTNAGIGENTYVMNLTGIAKGVYFIRISNDKITLVKKITKI